MAGSVENVAREDIVVAEIGFRCDAAEVAGGYERSASIGDTRGYSGYVGAVFLGCVAVEISSGLEDLCNYDFVAHKVALGVGHANCRVDSGTFWKSPPVCEVCGVGLRGLRVQIQLVARRRHRSSVALNVAIVAGQWLVFEYDYGVVGQNSIRGWGCIRARVNGSGEDWGKRKH